MEHRAPSSGVAPAVTSSNVRRRSGGAMTFKRNANANADSFPSSHSQPSVSVVSGNELPCSQLHTLSLGPSHTAGRSSVGRVGDGRSISLVLDNQTKFIFTSDSAGYHVYSSVATSEVVASGESTSASRQPPSGNGDVLRSLDNPAISAGPSPSPAFPQPPSMIRSLSAEFQFSGTTYFGISGDSGHGGFTRVPLTTDKLTKKWPAPRNFKDLELHHKEGTVPTPALEEGQGLGLTIAKWTVFKWCLLLSVMTVLVAGCAGLITAILTWSNSKPIFYPTYPTHFTFLVYSVAELSGNGRGRL